MDGKSRSIKLHVPEYSELWYRRQLLADPDTMSYNKGCNISFEGYDKATGCIDFPEDKWQGWYRQWTGRTDVRFYAYIVLDGKFIGEVNLHRDPDSDWYDDRFNMGIVIESHYRGNGYALTAMELLLERAFEEVGAASVHNEFESYRTAAALRLHLNAGFSVDSDDGHITRLSITARQYFDREKG
ncbi:MAG: GNAT family N-acetyltransferase [Oscillospiraceae bacterium]|nr:GNAT family N-acetyltransferase [Oscillospiraceae bacterium]